MMRASRQAIRHMALCVALALGGCAAQPQRTLVPQARLEQDLSVGQTSTAQALAALGAPSLMVKFDSGYQVWLYEYAAPAAQAAGRDGPAVAECVVLFDRDGVVRKIRRLPP
jgi:hypothetical protein